MNDDGLVLVVHKYIYIFFYEQPAADRIIHHVVRPGDIDSADAVPSTAVWAFQFFIAMALRRPSGGFSLMRSKLWLGFLVLALLPPQVTFAATNTSARQVRLGDVSTLEGVRDDIVIGYGMVGAFTVLVTKWRASSQFKPCRLVVKNVAGVCDGRAFPPFCAPGHTELTSRSPPVGDAKSLDGGMLLFTTLHRPDGQMWATAQGTLGQRRLFGGWARELGADQSPRPHQAFPQEELSSGTLQ